MDKEEENEKEKRRRWDEMARAVFPPHWLPRPHLVVAQ